ncbi:MAG TPA: FUSC family protein [Aliidongia sp.]|nr:FUSC family protein [Aliidongia sp.]
MTLLADIALPRPTGLLAFLGAELAPRPGRVAAVTRIAANCTVVVAIAMLYQIPLPAYMAYAVFLVSREEAASTLLTGVVALLAFTIAVGLSLLFFTLDASEPALRLPLMAVATFVGMFLVRTMALGPVAFLASFVLVLSQTLIDKIPSLETLTRLVLWLWVVVAVPVALTVLVNLAIGENPSRLALRTALRLLAALSAALRGDENQPLEHLQAEAVGLIELRQRAGMLDHSLRSRSAIDTGLIETLAELMTLQALLPAGTPDAVRRQLAAACDGAAVALEHHDQPAPMTILPDEAQLRALSPEARPVVVAMAAALTRLDDGIARRRAGEAPATPPAKSPFVPDAFTNPGHARFALKTTIAVMAAYIIYTGLDWPGISTSVTTCFFVALGSLGETMHKLTLRLVGALVGGLLGGLSIVYLLPEMTDIGQLCLLIAAVSFAGGWVATSSELLSYAGMQAAFAFFLGVLQGYGPSTDLTVLRDRVAGILLGNVLMSVVFSVLWPTSADDRARASLAGALRTLGQLLGAEARAKPGARLAVVQALEGARRFFTIATFELRMLPARAWPEPRAGLSLAVLDRLAAAAFVVVEQADDPAVDGTVRAQDEAAGAWLLAGAARVSGKDADAPLPDPVELGYTAAEAPALLGAAIEARRLLRREIEHAAAAGI